MKIKKFCLFLVFITAAAGGFGVANAQNPDAREAVISFSADIRVNVDNSVNVTETIVYNTGNIERHGIIREIYKYSSDKRKMDFENISVTDETGIPYVFSLSSYGDYEKIKIGDPNEVFIGQKTYVIKYEAAGAVAQFKDFDEIYWNVTGNEWNIPIYEARASVSLPSGTSPTQTACYYGPKGSKSTCPYSIQNDRQEFYAPEQLEPDNGLTVAVGFPKGIVTPYTSLDKTQSSIEKYWAWPLAFLLPFLTFIFSYRRWSKNGRDPKGRGTIVVQYDVPDDLTPMEVSAIANEKINSSHFSAEIIYLATKGYLKINKIERTHLGILNSTSYELIKARGFSGLPNDFDLKLLEALFGKKEKIELLDLKDKFFKEIPGIREAALNGLLKKGYYKNLGKMKMGGKGITFVIFSVWAGFFAGFVGGGFFGNPAPFIIGIVSSIIIYGIIYYFSPSKTEKGVFAKEHILGLKEYLQIAEKDRLHFHNAPEKNPEVFEKLLPFAMVLGVAKIWAKEFEDIYLPPPSWYSGETGRFNSVIFYQSLSNFNSFASTHMSSTGGSGGGGSSGGGGGGGGGGGW